MKTLMSPTPRICTQWVGRGTRGLAAASGAHAENRGCERNPESFCTCQGILTPRKRSEVLTGFYGGDLGKGLRVSAKGAGAEEGGFTRKGRAKSFKNTSCQRSFQRKAWGWGGVGEVEGALKKTNNHEGQEQAR